VDSLGPNEAAPGDDCPTREELLARFGQPERVDSAVPTVLGMLGQPTSLPPGFYAMGHRYPSVEAFEAYKTANLVRHKIGEHGIRQLGPVTIGPGVYGVILIGPIPQRADATAEEARHA
jgi:hypothetical protein